MLKSYPPPLAPSLSYYLQIYEKIEAVFEPQQMGRALNQEVESLSGLVMDYPLPAAPPLSPPPDAPTGFIAW